MLYYSLVGKQQQVMQLFSWKIMLHKKYKKILYPNIAGKISLSVPEKKYKKFRKAGMKHEKIIIYLLTF